MAFFISSCIVHVRKPDEDIYRIALDIAHVEPGHVAYLDDRVKSAFDIETIVDRSLKRLRLERLDLVQFHWWDYAEPRWLDALVWLDDLRRFGKVELIGGTNFDTRHVGQALSAGVPLSAMQVQYSVLDRRPDNGFAELCRAHGVALLCYGTVAGGFLSDRWLGAAEPTASAAWPACPAGRPSSATR